MCITAKSKASAGAGAEPEGSHAREASGTGDSGGGDSNLSAPTPAPGDVVNKEAKDNQDGWAGVGGGDSAGKAAGGVKEVAAEVKEGATVKEEGGDA
jgi:hypothetical protein